MEKLIENLNKSIEGLLEIVKIQGEEIQKLKKEVEYQGNILKTAVIK